MEAFIILRVVLFAILISSALALTTDERIRRDGYPVERHVVQTADGYILTMFRIPYSSGPKADTPKPVTFLQHGLLSSSDCWILNGPGIALAYMLVDAGYDVWLGNNRGNTYSRKHAQYSPLFPKFWHFEWHQIALYDMPAMIDYVLFKTKQKSLHYVGHSQGTTVFFVLTSMMPEYNAKFKSAQLLAPVVYMDNIRGPFISALTPLLGQPDALMKMLGSTEFLPSNELMSVIANYECMHDATAQLFCSSVMFAIFGYDLESFNATLFHDIVDTHPAGSSVNQVVHYLQEHISGQFRQFDYGLLRNLMVYGNFTPPKYDLSKVIVDIFLYYGENDFLAHPGDVERLKAVLPNVKYSFKVPNPRWNHSDHLWAKNVKAVVFDKVLANINKMQSILKDS